MVDVADGEDALHGIRVVLVEHGYEGVCQRAAIVGNVLLLRS